jgi:hypothetical protein
MPGHDATANIFLALNATSGVPDWIMLLPAGDKIDTNDGRGPYRVENRAKLMADSLQSAGGKLPIDENHATDLAAPQGGSSPARGWVVELQEREGAIWGRVEWTDAGRTLVSDKAYRGISPVIMVRKADGKTIDFIARASLVNTPNLRGMATLHSEGANMDLLKQLCEMLGMPANSDAAAVIAKVKGLNTSASANAAQLAPIAKLAGLKEDADAAAVLQAVTTLATATKTTLAPIAKAAGLKDDADATAVLNAVTALATAAKGAEGVVALQGELATLTTSHNALLKSIATDKATAFVDGAIKAGRVGVKPVRDHYIARHAIDAASAAAVEKEINAMPILGPSGALVTPPARLENGEVQLNAEQLGTAKLLGLDPKAYAKTLATEQQQAA